MGVVLGTLLHFIENFPLLSFRCQKYFDSSVSLDLPWYGICLKPVSSSTYVGMCIALLLSDSSNCVIRTQAIALTEHEFRCLQ